MKARTLLALTLVTAAPSILFAQREPIPPPRVAMAAPPVEVAPASALVAVPLAPPDQAEPQAPKAPQPATAPQPPNAPKTFTATVAQPPPAPPAAPRPPAQLINVQIEVTLSDSKGSTKTLTMTVADGENGMNRTINNNSYNFNADASPNVVGNKIRLRLTADAIVPVIGEKPSSLALRQSQTVILNDGDSVEIARAADPLSDRTFVLSVKVKIQR